MEPIVHQTAETFWQRPFRLSNASYTAALLAYFVQPSVPMLKRKKKYLGGK